MASLKDLKIRIGSVKKTQKITKAMQMVAAAKLRRAREQAEASRPYAGRMERMVASLATALSDNADAPKLLAGTGRDDIHLFVVVTADRGLCGAFNSAIFRSVRSRIEQLKAEGKQVKILCIGKKGRELFFHAYADLITDSIEGISKRKAEYGDGEDIAKQIILRLDQEEFDVCTLVFNTFKSAISQIVTFQQLVPLALPESDEAERETSGRAVYEYEPEEEEILANLLPRNLAVQCYKALLESQASEHGARMTAMDNATRNASDMIRDLSLVYNRTRQAQITTELVEIISGAEAL